MENIFENAYFSKRYRTRGGKLALYCMKYEEIHYLIVDGWCDAIAYNSDGSIWNILKNNIDDVIISEWQEEINEEELDELATKNTIADLGYEFDSHDYTDHSGRNAHWASYREGWKNAYRKVIEKYGSK